MSDTPYILCLVGLCNLITFTLNFKDVDNSVCQSALRLSVCKLRFHYHAPYQMQFSSFRSQRLSSGIKNDDCEFYLLYLISFLIFQLLGG